MLRIPIDGWRSWRRSRAPGRGARFRGWADKRVAGRSLMGAGSALVTRPPPPPLGIARGMHLPVARHDMAGRLWPADALGSMLPGEFDIVNKEGM